MALSNDEASEGIWDVKGEVSAPGAARGRFDGGGVRRGVWELGLEFWHLFSENRCFHSRSGKKMEKTEKGGRWRRRIFFSKKNRILLFK